jgi:NCAIR mutase (PurE)-related protein
VDRGELRELLRAVADGSTPVSSAEAALAQVATAGYADLGFAKLDVHRGVRTGDPEVVYAEGKSVEQVVALLRALDGQPGARAALATRVPAEMAATLTTTFPGARWDPAARCLAVGPPPEPTGAVVVVSAGTSDDAVAAEAAFVAASFGAAVRRVCDVGVAGVHRLLGEREVLEQADCLVVVAGMDGALPSVVGGLVGTPIVAVPTSVGYGASFGGLAALLTMLNSCAPGVAVVNIDNGFGAGVFAARVARQVGG